MFMAIKLNFQPLLNANIMSLIVVDFRLKLNFLYVVQNRLWAETTTLLMLHKNLCQACSKIEAVERISLKKNLNKLTTSLPIFTNK